MLEARLELIEPATSSYVPETIHLVDDRTIIGRSKSKSDVVLDLDISRTQTNTISRQHAEFTRETRNGRCVFVVHDLKSTNGVFVNDVKIEEEELQDLDLVQFGGAAGVPTGTSFSTTVGGRGDQVHKFAQYRFKLVGENGQEAESSRKRKRMNEAKTEVLESKTKRKLCPSSPSAVLPDNVPALVEEMERKDGRICTLHRLNGQLQEELHRAKQEKIEARNKLEWQSDERERLQKEVRMLQGYKAGLGKVMADSLSAKRASGSQQSTTSNQAIQTEEATAQESNQAVVAKNKNLFADVSCSICHDILLEAAILPCSHGYCSSCWGASSASACLICEAECQDVKPVHSMHLDNAIAILVAELGGKELQKKWERRLQRAAAGKSREEEDEEDKPASQDAEAEPKPKADCPGCMETGHTLDECPHRSDDDDDEESEDDGGEESEDEDDHEESES